jgi:hypothetical protein
MDEKQPIEIIKTPKDGVVPITGEVSPSEYSCLDDNTVRDLYYSIGILKQQSSRIDPYTGKIFETNSSHDNIQLSGALHHIIEFVEDILPRKPRLKRVRKARLRREGRLRRERPPRPDMAGRSWSDEESRWLVEQFNEGIGILELAIRHQRTKGAIRAQLKRLGKME